MPLPTKPENIPYKLLQQLEPKSPLKGLGDGDGDEPTQALTSAYITTMYYSALSNLYIQSLLPDTAENFEAMPRLKIALDRTKNDFYLSAKWLTENGADFIQTSTAKNYYNEIIALDDGCIIDSETAYVDIDDTNEQE